MSWDELSYRNDAISFITEIVYMYTVQHLAFQGILLQAPTGYLWCVTVDTYKLGAKVCL